MDPARISPYIRIAWDSVLQPARFIAERVIFDYELLFLKSGELEVTVEDKVYHGLPGDIFFFRPRQRHSLRVLNEAPVRQPHIHFDFFQDDRSPNIKVSYKDLVDMDAEERHQFRTDIADRFYPGFPSFIRLDSPQSMETMFFNLIYEYENRMVFSDLAVKGLFIQLWVQLLREILWQNTMQGKAGLALAYKLKNYLDQNVNRDLTLDEMSDSIHVSKFHLCRQFKSYYGTSPIQYHLISRLNKSKEMLQYSDQSVSAIAEQFGFQSIHSYSRAFKNHEGVAPSAYRKDNNISHPVE